MTVSREWYLLQTKGRREAVVRENLERQGYVTWLPRPRVRRPRSERTEPLFPGYLFVRLSPEVDNFGPIRSTIGVLRLVPGDSVEIIEGALAGYEAVVPRLRGRDRVALLLKVAGRHVALVARSDAVQRIT